MTRVASACAIAAALGACQSPVLLPAPLPEASYLERCRAIHSDPEACVQGPHEIVGVRTGFAYFYLVPTGGGLVLIDSGANRQGGELLHVLGDAEVFGILLTHAHLDHWAGAHLVNAPAYLGFRDAPRFMGRERNRALVPWLGDLFGRKPPRPTRVFATRDGAEVSLGGGHFTAVRIAGHTPGSTVWLYKDVAFVGDAILRQDDGSLDVAPGILSDDVGEARHSALRLLGYPFQVIFDGHRGRTDDAPKKLRQAAARWAHL